MKLLPAQPATSITAEAPSDKPSDNLPVSLAHLAHDPPGRRRGEPGPDHGRRNGDSDRPQGARERAGQVLRRIRTCRSTRPCSRSTRDLKYSELVKVINAFSNAFIHAKKEPKISFDELIPGEGE